LTPAMPAFAHSTSSRPWRSRTRATIASIAARVRNVDDLGFTSHPRGHRPRPIRIPVCHDDRRPDGGKGSRSRRPISDAPPVVTHPPTLQFPYDPPTGGGPVDAPGGWLVGAQSQYPLRPPYLPSQTTRLRVRAATARARSTPGRSQRHSR